MQRKVAPIDNPITNNNVPIHLPKIKPAKIATGEPNPAANTHTIVNKTKIDAKKNKFDCLNSIK